MITLNLEDFTLFPQAGTKSKYWCQVFDRNKVEGIKIGDLVKLDGVDYSIAGIEIHKRPTSELIKHFENLKSFNLSITLIVKIC